MLSYEIVLRQSRPCGQRQHGLRRVGAARHQPLHFCVNIQLALSDACMVLETDCLILVDNSNVFIEGQKQSARLKGIPPDPVTFRDPTDPSWRIDFGGLITELAAGRKIHDAILVGSRPPRNDSVWEAASLNGFKVTVHERSSDNREKAVDTELVAQGTELIVLAPEPMILVLASGDRDFIPLVNVAHRRGWLVELCAFSSAFNPSGELATTADRVRPLDAAILKIGRNEFHWPVPVP
jgi:uncharacterized LabA/DUF88 family protein